MRFPIFAAVLCFVLDVGALQNAVAPTALTQPGVDTNICEIVKHSRKYAGLRVRVPAEILHSGIHGGALVDPRCTRGLTLSFAKGAENNPDVVALDNAIYKQGCIGTAFKQIQATVSGKVVKDSADGYRSRKVYVLEIDKVENLSVKVEPEHCD
jgi:hypothetical protein